MPLQKKYHWSSLIIPPYYLACARFVVEGKRQVSSLLRFRLFDWKLSETFRIQAPNKIGNFMNFGFPIFPVIYL